MTTNLTPEQSEALDIARTLAAAGVPVFVAPADPSSRIGFRLPSGWESTPADPRAVDAWQPGAALCAVMGQGLDLLDIDPHKGGDLSPLGGQTPTPYATATTPSGGVHSFMATIGVRSRDNVLPGIDVKAGDAEGRGRGFAFIAPTVKPSKLTGQPGAYRWVMVPDTTRLRTVMTGEAVDDTGAGLRELIHQVRAATTTAAEGTPYDGPPFEEMPADLQQTVRGWLAGAVEGVRRELKESAGWSPGQTDDRGRGWEKLQADAALRLGRLARATWNDLELVDAEAIFAEAAPVDGSWGSDDVALKWSQQHHRLDPAPWPDLRSASERDAEAWAALGVEPVAAAGGAGSGAPEAPGGAPAGAADGPPAGDAARYFGTGGIQAATLAGDALAFGPLRVGRDDVLWSYGSGVWTSDKHAVRDRLTRLLGQRFRTNFVGTVEAMVRAHVDSITCDPVPELINFRNGLLDWRAGELRPHAPEVPSTVQLAVEYRPEAECPAFDAFLASAVPPDVIPTVWELIGYLMYSGNPLHKAVMLTGTGRNGKGTFLRVLEGVLGARNVTSVSLHDLVNTRFTTASLFGKLANIAGDIDATYLENTATFKAITGGDTISAEHKGRDRFDFKPWAVPVFSANKIPASADTSVGYLARWLVVPFPNDFTGREDRHLGARLHQTEELHGIAARGIAALGGLLDRGDFELTESGAAAREEFIRRVDQVRTWLADCCSVHPENPFVPRTDLYEAYKRWAARDGHKAVRATEFYDRLEQAGAEPAKVMGTRGFKRVRILDDGWATTGIMPVGAAGAQILTPEIQGHSAPSQASGATQRQDGPSGTGVSAPVAAPSVSAGQTTNAGELGAVGAGNPQPPYVRDAQVGGLGEPAPTAPRSDKPKRQVSEEAKAKAAATRATAKAEKRAAAIAEAAGERLELPAVVLADGTTTRCTATDAAALLAGVVELTVDVETTGFPPGHEHYALRTVQLGDERFAIVLDPAVDDQADVVRTALASAEKLHAHSATADLVPLALAGLVDHETAWDRMHDTVVPAKLADPASTGSDPGLKKLAEAILGPAACSPAADEARARLFKAGGWLTETKADTSVERSGWAQVDSRSETMIRYAASDVLDDAALARRLPQPEPRVLARERLAQRMTARVAYRGLRLDAEQVERLYAGQLEARADAAERLAAFGVEKPGSDIQVAEAVERLGLALPRTRTGRPSVAAGILEQHAQAEGDLGELVRARLTYQEAKNRIGLFLEGWRQAVTHGDGRVRPTVYTLEARSGRMSCVRPNLQQVPRSGGFRSCITADPGHVLISADFASVELRVAAALSQDTNLADIVSTPGRDIHHEVARIVWGPQAGKAQRYLAKPMVFGRLYGSGAAGMAATNGVSEATARAVIDALDSLTPGLAAWSRSVASGIEAGRTKFATHAGRVIHLPTDRPYAGANYAIQGTARELLIDALERWSATRWGRSVLLPVHDELVVHVPEDDAHEATAALVEAMTTELYGVPIVAEADEPSFRWEDAA